jgi:hypothetical protein
MAVIKIPTAAIVTAAEQIADVVEATVQEHIDAAARARGYRHGDALAGYVASTIPKSAAEAKAFVAWRDAVWTCAYGELAKLQADPRPQLAVPGLIAKLPAIVWPA